MSISESNAACLGERLKLNGEVEEEAASEVVPGPEGEAVRGTLPEAQSEAESEAYPVAESELEEASEAPS